MVNDLLKIFRNAENMDKAVLDNYIPKDGTYFRLNKDNTMERLTVKRNQTEQSELYQWFKEADYNSNLIDMNKPIDTTKKIHSNNYYTIFIKCDILPRIGSNKDKILTEEQLEEAISHYFGIFLEQTKDKKTEKIIETINLQEINLEELEYCKKRIKEAMPKIIQEIEDNELADKNYVKIFIEQNIEAYKREGKRYYYPRIFNKNDYNIEINGEIWGLSNNNMGLNSKKPYLELKTTKFKVPYRISLEETFISKKFFEWINNLVDEEGKTISNIYIPIDFKFTNTKVAESNIEDNTCLYIHKTTNNGKPIIEDFAIINRIEKMKPIKITNYLNLDKIEEQNIENRLILEAKIDEYYYNNKLKRNYYNNDIKAKTGVFSDKQVDILMTTKQAMLDYFKKGIEIGFRTCLDNMTKQMILEKFMDKEYINVKDIAYAENFRLNLLRYYQIGGKEEMGDRIKNLYETIKEKIEKNELAVCQTDEEFYFAAGQVIYYLVNQSEAQNKTQGLVTPFLELSTSIKLKQAIITMFKKYGYKIRLADNRTKNLIAMVTGYETNSKATDYQDLIISGICSKNMIFAGKKEEE